MDAPAVSMASGVINKKRKYHNALKFGFFRFLSDDYAHDRMVIGL